MRTVTKVALNILLVLTIEVPVCTLSPAVNNKEVSEEQDTAMLWNKKL